jgi:hypothetical protein
LGLTGCGPEARVTDECAAASIDHHIVEQTCDEAREVVHVDQSVAGQHTQPGIECGRDQQRIVGQNSESGRPLRDLCDHLQVALEID